MVVRCLRRRGRRGQLLHAGRGLGAGTGARARWGHAVALLPAAELLPGRSPLVYALRRVMPASILPPHPATLPQGTTMQPKGAEGQRPPHPATLARAVEPHPATVMQRREARTPHPATVAQRREAPFGVPKALPPHPATGVMGRAATAAQASSAFDRPPHPATVMLRRSPHPATVAQPRAAPIPRHPGAMVAGYDGSWDGPMSPAAQRTAVVDEAKVRETYATKKYAGTKVKATAKTAAISRELKATSEEAKARVLAIVKELDDAAIVVEKKKAAEKARPAHDAAIALAARERKNFAEDVHPAFSGVVYTTDGTVMTSVSGTLSEHTALPGLAAYLKASVEDRVDGRTKFSCAEPAVFDKLLRALQAKAINVGTADAVGAIRGNCRFYTVNKNGTYKEPCENCSQWVMEEKQ